MVATFARVSLTEFRRFITALKPGFLFSVGWRVAGSEEMGEAKQRSDSDGRSDISSDLSGALILSGLRPIGFALRVE